MKLVEVTVYTVGGPVSLLLNPDHIVSVEAIAGEGPHDFAEITHSTGRKITPVETWFAVLELLNWTVPEKTQEEEG